MVLGFVCGVVWGAAGGAGAALPHRWVCGVLREHVRAWWWVGMGGWGWDCPTSGMYVGGEMYVGGKGCEHWARFNWQAAE